MNITLQRLSSIQLKWFKIIMISALLLSAALFSYKAEGPHELHGKSTELSHITENHYNVASRHQLTIKPPSPVTLFMEMAALYIVAMSYIRTIHISFLRTFIPQKLKDLFLMPVKFTSIYVILFSNSHHTTLPTFTNTHSNRSWHYEY